MEQRSANNAAPLQRCLGRLPSKASRKALHFADFVKFTKLPTATNFWARRAPLPSEMFGNDRHGDCTIASQAHGAQRMERLETKRTALIDPDEVLRVYYALTGRLYGGGDTGAFETDALDNWRREDLTFRDKAGRPLTIAAYLRLDAFNHDEVRAAIALSAARGIKACFNLPQAWMDRRDHLWPAPPAGTSPIGIWLPGSAGGHSVWVDDYTKAGIELVSWGEKFTVPFEAAAIYMDEAHAILDSVDTWRTIAKTSNVAKLKIGDVIDAVNAVSSVRIAA